MRRSLAVISIMTTGIMPCNGIVEERRRYNGSIPCRENKGLYDNEQSPSAQYGVVLKGKALELMLEVILSKRPYIRIAGDDFPREIVKSRFLKINSGHLEYVFDCINKNTTKVGNIKAYLLAALYNAPATMDSYYRAEVNHDLYGC